MVSAPIPPANPNDPLSQSLAQLLDPMPLAHYLWQNKGLLNPLPLAEAAGQGLSTLGGGAARGLFNITDRLTGGDQIPGFPGGMDEVRALQHSLATQEQARTEKKAAEKAGKPPPRSPSEHTLVDESIAKRGAGQDQPPDTLHTIGRLLDPRPLASTIWENRGLLNPVTALEHYGNFAKMMGGGFADYAENMNKLHGIDESEEYRKQLELDRANQEDPHTSIFNTELEKAQVAADYKLGLQKQRDSGLTPEQVLNSADRGLTTAEQHFAKTGTGYDQPDHASRAKPEIPYPMLAPRPPDMPFNVNVHSGPSFSPPGVTAQQPYSGMNPLEAWLQMFRGAQQ